MKILVCPCNRTGSGIYRLGLPVAVLQKQESGLNIYLSEGLPASIDSRTGRAIGLADGFGGWDVVVLQRPMSYWQAACLRDCRKLGIRTIVEVDDDFRALPAHNPAWRQTNPRFNNDWNHRWLDIACREADMVTVTTPALARRYAPHGRVAIIQNYVPQAWLAVTAERSGDLVGWTGSVEFHQGDLPVTRGGVAQALRDAQARFRVIGDPALVKRDLSLADEPENVPWRAWGDYPLEIAKLDVGIAPLVDTAFNRSKSWLKPLEYAACGVPCLASPLPSYKTLSTQGIGILVRDRARDWHRELLRLLRDESYRTDMGLRARDAAQTLTVERNAWRFAEAWAGQKPSAMGTIAALSAS